jgi:hypothetical protein
MDEEKLIILVQGQECLYNCIIDLTTVFRKTEYRKMCESLGCCGLKFSGVLHLAKIINTYRRDIRSSGMLCRLNW